MGFYPAKDQVETLSPAHLPGLGGHGQRRKRLGVAGDLWSIGTGTKPFADGIP